MLARICRASPQFINSSDGSLFGPYADIRRLEQKALMFSGACGKRSLTGMPQRPYFLNLNGDANAAPVLRSVGKFSIGSNLPAYLSSAGLGSNVSTCEGPPFV